MATVSFHNVSKRFGKSVALDNLNLTVGDTEFISLLGPSGSGKSTTLNLLAGLIPIDDGEIYIRDRLVNDLSPDRRDIAMVFQNYALYPHMTVFENLAFPLRAKGRRRPEAEIKTKIETVADMLGVADYLARFPKELSGGQQQRIALGRAMVRDPEVFLLDEPLSNLDARLRIRMRRDIKALHDRLKSTIIYVTHDQAEAMTLSTRIVVFNKGTMQQVGSPFEIYNRPCNKFVANFVGDREINFLPGRTSRADGVVRFRGDGFQAIVGAAADWGDAAADAAVDLGIRAEAITLSVNPDDPGIPGIVTQTELVGPDLIVYVRLGAKEIWCRTDPRSPVKRDDAVRVGFKTDEIHLFDPLTEISLRPN